MDSRPGFLLVITLTTFLLSIDSFLAHLTLHHHHHHYNGPTTNITKHLHFSSFNPNTNPTIIHDIKLLGSSKISEVKGSIQIPDSSSTVDLKYQSGRAIYSSPIRIFDPLSQTPASFRTTFSFQITTTASSTATTDRGGGGGLAFVIVPDEFTVGRPGPWLGILNDACDNHYKTFAIEFDTSQDTDYDDPNDNHVGVNLGSIISIQTAPVSEIGVSLIDGSVHRAWIHYDSVHKQLTVHLGPEGGSFPSKPILAVHLDLSPYLKEYMFIGFSASTGNISQIHNILSWNFSSTVQAFLHIPSSRTCKQNLALQGLKFSKNSKKPPNNFIIFIIVMGLCLLSLINLYCKNSCRKSTSKPFIIPEKKPRPLPPNIARKYTMSEIHRATRSFSKNEVLGIDSRGVLHRGTQINGTCLAIKRFTIKLDQNRVLKLITLMSQTCHHPNLGKIRGWCLNNQEIIVVYDYFQNGSLNKWLIGLGFVPWARRLKMIKEVAEALNYLHSKEIIHGFLKTSSVFIDANYSAILSDYGFIVQESDELKKRDVFEFGVIVLEIIGGKKRLELERGDEEEVEDVRIIGLVRRAHERGEINQVFDERMGLCVVNSEEAIRVVEIGLICTLDESKGRPPMEEVVQFLNMDKPIPKFSYDGLQK